MPDLQGQYGAARHVSLDMGDSTALMAATAGPKTSLEVLMATQMQAPLEPSVCTAPVACGQPSVGCDGHIGSDYITILPRCQIYLHGYTSLTDDVAWHGHLEDTPFSTSARCAIVSAGPQRTSRTILAWCGSRDPHLSLKRCGAKESPPAHIRRHSCHTTGS
jgi:hypothetical protein